MSVQDNIEDREWFDLMVAERGPRFWELCHEKLFPEVVDKVEEDESVHVMSRQEADAFGKTHMEFGQYQGCPVRHTPIDYLDWLAASSTQWMKQLNRYLRFKHRGQ